MLERTTETVKRRVDLVMPGTMLATIEPGKQAGPGAGVPFSVAPGKGGMARAQEISATRSVAFDMLRGVLARRRTLDREMTTHNGYRRLPARDRAFARLIVSTVLRRTGQIDAVLDAFLERPLPRSGDAVQDILRLATAEILFLGVGAHASVDSAVSLTTSRGLERFSGLVNAVLRRVAREGGAALAGIPETRNLPDWLLASWTDRFGTEDAERAVAASLAIPPLDISVGTDAERWARELDATVLPTGTLRRKFGGAVSDLPGYADGAWWVQDAAAALPVRLFGDLDGRTALDLCAAPGGKTAQLVAAGARVTAIDRARSRLDRLRRNLGRLGMKARTLVADGTAWRPGRLFDCVLVDAPCLATGTIRRNPDSLHNKHPGHLEGLIALQDALLDAAGELVRPGGRIVYCTCSLQSEEGEDRIEALLGRAPGLRRVPVNAGEIGGLDAAVTGAGDMQTMPFHLAGHGGMDGFFAARLEREA